jgi:dTDP-4-amino-4,6-dideoxygalactose transaminase
MYYLLLPTPELRNALLTYLNAACDINSVFHYLPLHLSRMGRTFGGKERQCPVAEDVSERLLRLPFYTGLSDADQSRVVAALNDFTAAEICARADSLSL